MTEEGEDGVGQGLGRAGLWWEAGSSEVEGRAAASGAARSELAGVTDDEARVLLPETAAPLFFFPGLVAMPTVAVAGAGLLSLLPFVVEFVVEGGFVGAGDDDRERLWTKACLWLAWLLASACSAVEGGRARRGSSRRLRLKELANAASTFRLRPPLLGLALASLPRLVLERLRARFTWRWRRGSGRWRLLRLLLLLLWLSLLTLIQLLQLLWLPSSHLGKGRQRRVQAGTRIIGELCAVHQLLRFRFFHADSKRRLEQ